MKYTLHVLCISLLYNVFISCTDEASNAGDVWVDSSLRNVRIDTCTVLISTILADSVQTSGDSICQIGHYTDKYRGVIRGEFFTEYDYSTASFGEEVTYAFDSLMLTLHPSGSYMGDTLQYHQINIHRLEEIIELYDNSYLYNTSTVKYDAIPVHTFSFRPRPKMKEVIEVRLPDEFGLELFEEMRSQSLVFDSQERFRQYFPGLLFRPGDSNNCITGFGASDSSFCLTLHYHSVEGTKTEMTVNFKPSETYKFNKATQDRTITAFEKLEPGTLNGMYSGETENVAYLQGLTGLYIKVEFPHLNNLLWQGDLVSIESAVLYLYPVQDSYGNGVELPETLTLYTTNEDDVTDGVIYDNLGENVQDGSLVISDSQNVAYYSFDVTSFLQTNLGTFGRNRQNLMLMLPDDKFQTTMSSLVLGDMNHPDNNNIKLELIYKVYTK